MIQIVPSGNGSGDVTLVNCTGTQNDEVTSGDGQYFIGVSGSMGSKTLHLYNSILWDNGVLTPVESAGGFTVSYSDIEGGWGGAGSNNLNANPDLVDDPSSYDWWPDPETSLCLDAGNNSYASGTDLVGATRIVNEIVDLGAHEAQ